MLMLQLFNLLFTTLVENNSTNLSSCSSDRLMKRGVAVCHVTNVCRLNCYRKYKINFKISHGE